MFSCPKKTVNKNQGLFNIKREEFVARLFELVLFTIFNPI